MHCFSVQMQTRMIAVVLDQRRTDHRSVDDRETYVLFNVLLVVLQHSKVRSGGKEEGAIVPDIDEITTQLRPLTQQCLLVKSNRRTTSSV